MAVGDWDCRKCLEHVCESYEELTAPLRREFARRLQEKDMEIERLKIDIEFLKGQIPKKQLRYGQGRTSA